MRVTRCLGYTTHWHSTPARERSTRKMSGGEFGPGRCFSLHGNPRAMLLAFPGVVARSSYPLSIEYYTEYEWRMENRKRSLNNV
ncbi:hypothetical protein G9C98_007716 [Cotesia typhae]|uniref:Uncharacterized protein n=1 Tax=Cotesia typhae TaxID=2053667 RepID=A0A8J5QLD0_9HYME|nr:hypothetical protein G9C98_007716 [Cotesia typhae]